MSHRPFPKSEAAANHLAVTAIAYALLESPNHKLFSICLSALGPLQDILLHIDSHQSEWRQDFNVVPINRPVLTTIASALLNSPRPDLDQLCLTLQEDPDPEIRELHYPAYRGFKNALGRILEAQAFQGQLQIENRDSVYFTDSSLEREGRRHLTKDQICSAQLAPYRYKALRSPNLGNGAHKEYVTRLISFDNDVCTPNEVVVRIGTFTISTSSRSEEYCAISYVWGNGASTHSLLCDEGTSSLRISERLHKLLKQLRAVSSVGKFWIDAISINQSDPVERGSQVQHMSEIYRRAARVHVFPGAFSLDPKACLDSEWFSRRWIVQEFIAARKAVFHREAPELCNDGFSVEPEKPRDYTTFELELIVAQYNLMLEKYNLSVDELVLGMRKWHSVYKYPDRGSSAFSPELLFWQLNKAISDHGLDVETLVSKLREWCHVELSPAIRGYILREESTFTPKFQGILKQLGYDMETLILAIRSLSDEDGNLVAPRHKHYYLSSDLVFRDFNNALQRKVIDKEDEVVKSSTIRMVKELGEIQAQGARRLGILSLLLIFHHTNCKDDRDRLFAFFGAAHDIVDPTASLPSDPISTAIASAMIKCVPNYQLSTAQVYIDFAIAVLKSGYPLDIIHCTGAFRLHKRANSRPTSSQEYLPSWVPDWRLPPLFLPLMKADHFRAGCPPAIKTRPIVVVDNNSLEVTIRGVLIGTVIDSLNCCMTGIDTIAHVSYLRSECLDMSLDRCGFEVLDGRGNRMRGYGPVDVEEGNMLVIFAGGRTPFLLRSFSPNRYTIVGDAYVPQLMNGTVFTSAMQGGFNDFTLV